MAKKIKLKPKLNKSANSEWEIVDDIPMAQDGKKIKNPIYNLSHEDSVKHQADKILKYEQLRGSPTGSPLPYYGEPQYMNMLMKGVYPEVNKILPNASAMEKGEAMDFIFNAGWDKDNNKIIKDPRAYALQEYYRKYDSSKLKDGKWEGRKNAPYSFDEEYNTTIEKLPENERRILMNKGRDWYYKNINNTSPGVPNPAYENTWYGRIWNTNDFNEFNPNNPNFIPKKKHGGSISQQGYRDDSPYRNRKSIDIHTNSGLIDMSETGIPIFANGRFLPPYSGMHQFEPGVVKEKRVMQDGGRTPIKIELAKPNLLTAQSHENCVSCEEWSKLIKKPGGVSELEIEAFNKKYPQGLPSSMYYTDEVDFNPTLPAPDWFSRPLKNSERPISKEDIGKRDYFDKKTGKFLGTYQDGGKISLDEFRPKFANSNEAIQQQMLQQKPMVKNLPEVEIVANKTRYNPYVEGNRNSQGAWNIPASQVAGSVFSFVPEAFHTPSRAVNYALGADKNNTLSFNPYQSEISETLGLKHNDPTDMWTGLRNFAVNNAADFVVPVEGFSNVGSKTIPKIGGAAKTGLREGVDLVHPVGRRLKQIEQEGVSQGLSTQAIKNRQMQEVGITSLQREGYFPGVSEVLSEYFVPYSYDNAKKRLLNIPKKIIKGDTNTKRLADLNKVILDQGENTLSKPRYDAWRMYSGLPQKHGTFRMAETSPINHPSYTQNQLSNLEKFSLNDERRLLTTLPNEYDNLRFMYNDDDLLNNVNYLKEQLKDINVLQKKGIDFPQSDFTTTNVMGGYNRRFFDNKMEYNDVWDLDFNGIKVDNYYGKPFMSHGQLDYSLEAPKKVINTLLNRANSLERNINPVKGKTKYDFDNIKLKNYINLQDVKTTKKKLGGKINSSDWEIL